MRCKVFWNSYRRNLLAEGVSPSRIMSRDFPANRRNQPKDAVYETYFPKFDVSVEPSKIYSRAFKSNETTPKIEIVYSTELIPPK